MKSPGFKVHISNEAVFPFTFIPGVSAQQDVPAPFDEVNIPRIGYIGARVVYLDRLSGEGIPEEYVEDSSDRKET
jgi:hypothetical protein